MSGGRANVSYVKGIHNIKAGITYEDTILTEQDIVRDRRSHVSLESSRRSAAGMH